MYINLNRKAFHIKLYKHNTPIRLLVNWYIDPAFRLATYLAQMLKENLCLSYTYMRGEGEAVTKCSYKLIVACLLKARIVKPAETDVAREWLCKQRLLLGNGSVVITWSLQQTGTQQWSNCGKQCFLRGPCQCCKMQSSCHYKLCRTKAEVILNHVNPHVGGTGQGEASHRKYKRLKLDGGLRLFI
jgi:hypothetical protein